MTNRRSLPELEDYIRSINARGYADTRNYIGGSTRLSEYISRGFISLPRVRDLLLEHNSESESFKLLGELAWREYWQQTWRVRGKEIFDYFRPLKTKPRQGIPSAVLNAATGIDALDNGIRRLYDTGFIDNHLRMWLAGLICNVAKCDWKVGAAWMHSLLVDGDFASNHLSWQWVAGSYTGSQYLPQQDNINKYTKTKQSGTYLDNTYQYITDMPIPEPLAELSVELPAHQAELPVSTISLEQIAQAENLLLYSPWTLDPTWRTDQPGTRLLVLPTDIYSPGAYSQNVIDSIRYYADQIDGIEIASLSLEQINSLSNQNVFRKDYPGIVDWPGQIDGPELLHPDVPLKFYPSYSAYWKAINKHRKEP